MLTPNIRAVKGANSNFCSMNFKNQHFNTELIKSICLSNDKNLFWVFLKFKVFYQLLRGTRSAFVMFLWHKVIKEVA